MNLLRSIFGSPVPGLDPAAAQARLQAPQAPFLLDVRQPDEFAAGHIAGAQLIPLGELPRRLSELPREREILCVCWSGSRSQAAAQQLIAAGFKVTNINGGMMAWQQAKLPVKKGMEG